MDNTSPSVLLLAMYRYTKDHHSIPQTSILYDPHHSSLTSEQTLSRTSLEINSSSDVLALSKADRVQTGELGLQVLQEYSATQYIGEVIRH